jgi:ferric enterobactin receptor
MRKVPRMLVTFCLSFLLWHVAQAQKVSGTVVSSDDNSPLLGVTVTNKTTGSGSTQTNAVGYFTINATKGQVLVFTYVGFSRQEITVGDQTIIGVKLLTNEKEGSVVTVYGMRKSKRELGYFAQEVKGEDIAQTKRENFLNALSGRVAGVNITPTSGLPGSSTSIVLRGVTSIGGNNQPLIVVDGIPYDNQTINQENLASGNSVALGNRSSDYTNRAADINSEDIETLTVLKGPEATALYGSDGASGAIIITTKKGKAGRANVTYTNSFRVDRVYRFPETQRTYARGANGVYDANATVNPFAGGLLYAYFGPKYPANTKFYDNFDAFFKDGFTQNHNINVDGGSEGITYRLSGNFIDQKGMVPNTAFQRYTIRLGNGIRISPKLNLQTSLTYTGSKTKKAPKGVGSYFLTLLNFPADVDASIYTNPDGSKKPIRGVALGTTDSDNPFWDVNKNKASDRTDRFNGNGTISYDPSKSLNFTWATGVDMYTSTGDYLTHPQSRFGFSTNGFYSVYEQVTRNTSNVIKGTYRKKFGNFQNTVTVGFAADDFKTRIESQRGEQYYELGYESLNNTAPTSQLAKTTVLNYRLVRFFANYSVGYKNMVFVSVAGSREGNSKLNSAVVEKDPFYSYGSGSLSFVFTDIKGVDKIDWLSYGKLRVSYGTTGKGPVTPYIIDEQFVAQITTGGGYALGVTGSNQRLTRESTRNLEYGAEFRFLNDRFSIDFTRYQLRSADQILSARSSYGTGYILKYFNGGLVQNRGFEVTLKGDIIKKSKFTWDALVNFDLNRGKILEMPKSLPTYYDSDTWVFGNLRSQAYVGASTGNLSGSIYGMNTNNQILISPTTGLPTSTGADFYLVGDRQPDFKVGVINTFHYGDWSLNFNLDFRYGGDVFNGNAYFLWLTGLSPRTMDREQPRVITGVLNDGLQNTSDPTKNSILVSPYYRSDYYGATNNTESDFIENVKWMRLRDATLSYTFPSKLMKKQKVFKSVSVYVTGTDLFMITNYTGADPSVNANTASGKGYGGAGIDYGTLSTPRGLLIGCNVKF